MTGFSSPTPPGAFFDGGAPINIRAGASDAAGVVSVTFELDGTTFEDAAAPYEWSTTTPVPAVLTTFPIRATAVDGLGNSKTIQTTIRVRSAQIAPTLHPELVTIGYDFFGLSAIGQPGAVTDPTDPPLSVVVRNLRTAVVRCQLCPRRRQLLGSCSKVSTVTASSSVAYDSIGLASSADDARYRSSATKAGVANLGFGAAFVAVQAAEFAVCDCYYEPPGPETGEAGPHRLADLIDASSPLAPVAQGELQIPLQWSWEDPCSTGGAACTNSCGATTGYQPCYNDCVNACPSGDGACYDGCATSCGGAQFAACTAHCDAGTALCGPYRSLRRGGAGLHGARARRRAAAPTASAACDAFSNVCSAAPPTPGCLTGPSACTDFCYTLVDVEPCYGDCSAACAPEDDACYNSCYSICGGARMDSCADTCDAGWDSEDDGPLRVARLVRRRGDGLFFRLSGRRRRSRLHERVWAFRSGLRDRRRAATGRSIAIRSPASISPMARRR